MPLRLSILLITVSCLRSCWKEIGQSLLFVFCCAGVRLSTCASAGWGSLWTTFNGVRQGGVLSPILFTIFMDSLLESLRACGRGCYWKDHFSGALCYADVLTILAPCPDALRKMLSHCVEYAESHGIRFNASKTQLICFRRSSLPDSSRFLLQLCMVCTYRTIHATTNLCAIDCAQSAHLRPSW